MENLTANELLILYIAGGIIAYILIAAIIHSFVMALQNTLKKRFDSDIVFAGVALWPISVLGLPLFYLFTYSTAYLEEFFSYLIKKFV